MATTKKYSPEVSQPERIDFEMEPVVLPQIASIKQASAMMGLPVYYLRRLCKEVPGIAFQSGVNGTSTWDVWPITITAAWRSRKHKNLALSSILCDLATNFLPAENSAIVGVRRVTPIR